MFEIGFLFQFAKSRCSSKQIRRPSIRLAERRPVSFYQLVALNPNRGDVVLGQGLDTESVLMSAVLFGSSQRLDYFVVEILCCKRIIIRLYQRCDDSDLMKRPPTRVCSSSEAGLLQRK